LTNKKVVAFLQKIRKNRVNQAQYACCKKTPL